MDWSAKETTLRDVLAQAETDLGQGAVIDFDRDIATHAQCSCGNQKDIFNTVNRLRGKDVVCDVCGKSMKFDTIHTIRGTEDYIDKTLYEIGIPTYHIICARKGLEYIL